MARFVIDCRNVPSENDCTVSIEADAKPELLDAAAQHAVSVHGRQDGPELRSMLEQGTQVQQEH